MSDPAKPDLNLILGNIAEREACDARERIVASSTFRSAPQLASFLNFIVKTTLLGRQQELKGYTIAVEALGRPDDFDPVADPIVRVEAGRLRRAIDTYYAGEGADDPVRIVVERGSYVPRFERNPLAAGSPDRSATAPSLRHAVAPAGRTSATLPTDGSAAAPPPAGAVAGMAKRSRRGLIGAALAAAATVLAVAYVARRDGVQPPPAALQTATSESQLPLTSAARRQPSIQLVFVPGPDEALNDAMRLYGQHLSDALSRFDDFTVLKGAPGTEGAGPLQPTYRIEFNAVPESSDKIATGLSMADVANNRVVFSGSNEFPRLAMADRGLIKELARVNAVRIAQPYGRIHSDLRLNGSGGGAVQCAVRTYDYWSGPTAERHAEVRDCLEATVKADANYHPAWALLAMIHLDEYRIGYNPRSGSALERARRAAQQAVALAPESARALQGLMAILTVSGETAEALKVGFEAVRRNPFDTDILADLGARLTQAGRAREGRPLLLRAAEINRARPVWHEFYLFLSAREVGDVEGARSALKALELAEAPLALLAQAIGASDKGSREQSMAAMRKLAMVSPVFGENAGEFLDRAFFATEVRAMLLEALVRGGLDDLNKG